MSDDEQDPEAIVWGRQPASQRKAPRADSPLGLAQDWAERIQKVAWGIVMTPTNKATLAKFFREWLDSGVVTPEEIREMNRVYAEAPSFRNDRHVLWKDFLSKRQLLLFRVREIAEDRRKEESRDGDEEFWMIPEPDDDAPERHDVSRYLF